MTDFLDGEAGPSAPERHIERVYCNECGHDTKHERLQKRAQHGSEPYSAGVEISWTTVYTLYECCGCEAVSLKREFFFSEWNREESQVDYYPPRVSRKPPKWMTQLPTAEQELVTEIYRAVAADSRRLALMGARTLVDMFIVRTIGDAGGFAEKLKRLQTEGYVSRVNREILDAALEAGSASVHRGYQPSSEELTTVIDIVENLLQGQLLQGSAQELKKVVPPRPSKAKPDFPDT